MEAFARTRDCQREIALVLSVYGQRIKLFSELVMIVRVHTVDLEDYPVPTHQRIRTLEKYMTPKERTIMEGTHGDCPPSSQKGGQTIGRVKTMKHIIYCIICQTKDQSFIPSFLLKQTSAGFIPFSVETDSLSAVVEMAKNELGVLLNIGKELYMHSSDNTINRYFLCSIQNGAKIDNTQYNWMSIANIDKVQDLSVCRAVFEACCRLYNI